MASVLDTASLSPRPGFTISTVVPLKHPATRHTHSSLPGQGSRSAPVVPLKQPATRHTHTQVCQARLHDQHRHAPETPSDPSHTLKSARPGFTISTVVPLKQPATRHTHSSLPVNYTLKPASELSIYLLKAYSPVNRTGSPQGCSLVQTIHNSKNKLSI